MKVRISEEEWYPVYSIYKDDGNFINPLIEVSKEKYQEWERIDKEFQRIQMELSRLYKEETV